MTETGNYIITFYARKGKKLRQHTRFRSSLTRAKELGELFLGIGDRHSFTVDRRLHNSEDGK